MQLKDSNTVVLELHPAIHHAMNVVDRVWRRIVGQHPVITGLGEEGHSGGSFHYGLPGDIRCRAFDVRTRDLIRTQKDALRIELEKRLAHGLEFDLVWERTHLHIEFQPHE